MRSGAVGFRLKVPSDPPAPPPSSFVRRTLRSWAWIAGVHGVVIGLVVILLVPWKTAWVNVTLLLYGAAQLATAVGLWRRARWGWRLGLVTGLIGLVLGVLVVTGLLLSWLYLRAIYGAFGYGAAIVCLLFAAVAFQVLGLVPALQLRALLRREVRGPLGPARWPWRGLLLIALVPVVLAPLSFFPFRLLPIAPVPAGSRDQSLAVLRAAVAGEARPAAPDLVGVPLGPGPLYVTLWVRGRAVARVTGTGSDLAQAVDDAAHALVDHPGLAKGGRRPGRLKVDRVAAVGTLPSEHPFLVALSVVPGQDGLRRGTGPGGLALLPDDFILNDRFGSAPLLPGLREVRFGLDAAWALKRLVGATGALERVVLESWVESERGALAVVRGNTPLPPGGAAGFAEAATSAGKCLMKLLRKDGRFTYVYDALRHRHSGTSDASLPRHAGAIYGLAQLYAHTGNKRYKRAAARAAAWLTDHALGTCGTHRCVTTAPRAKLGSSALTLIALLEYQLLTKDDRFAEPAKALAELVLAWQRPGGDFHHVYDRTGEAIDPGPNLMFASEQAALGLLMAHEAFGEERFLAAAERALAYVTGPKYDYFLGWFTFGADHWTCIAAERAWPRLKHPRYLEFCKGYASFVGRLQFDGSLPAYDGHYGFTGVMVPQAPATAGFTEAIVATYLLSKHHGEPDEELRSQAVAALEALRRDQLRADNDYLVRNRRQARGAIRRSLVQQDVRVDFLQHSISALLGGLQL